MKSQEQCIICGRSNVEKTRPSPDTPHLIRQWGCGTCGPFLGIERNLRPKLSELNSDEKSRVSAFTRAREIGNQEPPLIVPSARKASNSRKSSLRWPIFVLDEVLSDFPQTVGQRLDRALLNLAELSSKPGEFVRISGHDYPVLYAEDESVATYLKKQLIARGLVELQNNTLGKLRLTVAGWNRVAELQRNPPMADRTQGFVAMWFSDKLHNAWKDGLRPAIKDAGYEAVRADSQEYNEKICDRIIAEIRKSRFIVADFTGHRGGVYFEAGFAMGLGLPVIFTCRIDAIDDAHFDTRQYNHIVWELPEDLREKVRNRIEATVPKGK